VITFDIERGDDTLKVQVLDVEPDDGSRAVGDRRRQVIGEVEIDLKRLSFEQQ